MSTDRERIEAVLRHLIGRPVWDFWRAADMLVVDIGGRVTIVNRRDENVEVGEYALHVQCRWRLRGPEGIVTGRRDIFWPAGVSPNDPAGHDWDMNGNSRSTARVTAYLDARGDDPPVLQDVEVNDVGDVSLRLSDGYLFETFLDSSLGDEDWRLFRSGKPNEGHFVVAGGRVRQDVAWA
jgi:hypothetical protein